MAETYSSTINIERLKMRSIWLLTLFSVVEQPIVSCITDVQIE